MSKMYIIARGRCAPWRVSDPVREDRIRFRGREWVVRTTHSTVALWLGDARGAQPCVEVGLDYARGAPFFVWSARADTRQIDADTARAVVQHVLSTLGTLGKESTSGGSGSVSGTSSGGKATQKNAGDMALAEGQESGSGRDPESSGIPRNCGAAGTDTASSDSPEPPSEGTPSMPVPASGQESDASESSRADGDGSEPGVDPSGSGSPPQDGGPAGPETSSAGAEAEAPGRGSLQKLLRSVRRKGGASAFSSRPIFRFGGLYADLSVEPPNPALVRRLRAAMARLRWAGETAEGPRIDPRRFATKVAGYLRSVTLSDHRVEEGRPAILVMADVSGSMSLVAPDVAAAAAAVGQLGVPGTDVVVVVQSNGIPQCVSVNGGPASYVNPEERDEVVKVYSHLFGRYDIRAVILFADWDGADVYLWMCSLPRIERFVWLDPWSCRKLSPRRVPFPPRYVGEVNWPPSAARKVVYFLAVGDLDSAIEAIEAASSSTYGGDG